jgi:chaperone required for assembly of F1-ATPase
MSTSSLNVSVTPVQDGFALSHDGEVLRTRGGNPIQHPSEELMQVIASTLASMPDVSIDGGTLKVPISVNLASMLMVTLDVVVPEKDPITSNFAKVLFADPMLHTIAGPEQLSREAAYEPVYSWLQHEIDLLRERAAELDSLAFDPNPEELAGPVPANIQESIDHIKLLYDLLSPEQRAVVNVLSMFHDHCLLLAMSLILNPVCDAQEYADGVIGALMLDSEVFSDVPKKETAAARARLERDAEAALHFLALTDTNDHDLDGEDE